MVMIFFEMKEIVSFIFGLWEKLKKLLSGALSEDFYSGGEIFCWNVMKFYWTFTQFFTVYQDW